jgi:hypothetical protein
MTEIPELAFPYLALYPQVQIKKKRFKDVSHALDYSIYQLMEEDKLARDR